MRIHTLAAAALATAFLAGCTGGGSEASTAAPAVTRSAATAEKPTDTALGADTEAICAQASRTSSEFGKTFAEDYQLLTRAAAEGAQEKAKAQEKVTRDLQSFSYALLDMSKLVSDPKVKEALAAMGAQVTALKGDIGQVDDKKLADLHDVLDKACGRG
ncbi:hypothetical protein QLQ12_06680 [Actinoplanes sp. NEAU-A12]|uniref:Small secreted protein n=1 Tax=Actinoplanes sandaracinus TaxID=3045177 RepID=A0ABT6WEZ2_9ACTN|nr:hypothetical protein [Actinoplanes sandaracinus]MDI6098286.1 hypothetical protein [Actinoplanes sandaracinus]